MLGGKFHVTSFCFDCGHSLEVHVAKEKASEWVSKKRKAIDEAKTEEEADRIAKRGQGGYRETGNSTNGDVWAGVRLKGGLRVHAPREWRLGDSAEALHEILREDGVAVVPEVIEEAEATAFGQGIVEVRMIGLQVR